MKSLGELIVSQRQKRGLSQQRLAERIGFKHGSQINRIEHGERKLLPEHIKPMAHVLGITQTALLDAYIHDHRETILKLMHAPKGGQ